MSISVDQSVEFKVNTGRHAEGRWQTVPRWANIWIIRCTNLIQVGKWPFRKIWLAESKKIAVATWGGECEWLNGAQRMKQWRSKCSIRRFHWRIEDHNPIRHRSQVGQNLFEFGEPYWSWILYVSGISRAVANCNSIIVMELMLSSGFPVIFLVIWRSLLKIPLKYNNIKAVNIVSL